MPYLLFWPLLHIELSVAMPKSCPSELRLIQNPSACTSSLSCFPSSVHYLHSASLSHLPVSCPAVIWWSLPANLSHLYKPWDAWVVSAGIQDEEGEGYSCQQRGFFSSYWCSDTTFWHSQQPGLVKCSCHGRVVGKRGPLGVTSYPSHSMTLWQP